MFGSSDFQMNQHPHERRFAFPEVNPGDAQREWQARRHADQERGVAFGDGVPDDGRHAERHGKRQRTLQHPAARAAAKRSAADRINGPSLLPSMDGSDAGSPAQHSDRSAEHKAQHDEEHASNGPDHPDRHGQAARQGGCPIKQGIDGRRDG